jgi:hypothetical protein
MSQIVNLSNALAVTTSQLKRSGVFDSYVGIDSRLHIDPALLRTTRVPELKGALKTFNGYFTDILKLIVRAEAGGALERQAIKKLVFPEINEAALGFSDSDCGGKGVSLRKAEQLFYTAKEIIEAGIEDPAIFELAIVFEDGFGPDLISDMTLCVILQHLSKFNERVCKKLGIETRTIRVKGFKTSTAAYSSKLDRCFLLIPMGILSTLPEATCREDIDDIISYNDSVREELNRILGKNWSNAAKVLGKRGLRDVFFQNPDIFKRLIECYKQKTPEAYDFNADPLGELIWNEYAKAATMEQALKLQQPASQEQLNSLVELICQQFKKLVELNGWHSALFNEAGRHRPEKFAQLLFYGIADIYCAANNLDLSREPNAGRGPVDFKLSRGSERCLVEFKLSSNTKPVEGLLRQLPEYAKAERSSYDVLLMVVISENRRNIEKAEKAFNEYRSKGLTVPDLIIVEAYKAKHAPSASKLRFE